MEGKMLTRMAISATLHCLLGCSIGEIIGMILGTMFGLANAPTIGLSTGLSFMCGYALSTLPLLRAGLGLKAAVLTVLAADTLSILSMEVTDNLVMAVVPGAMNAGLNNPLFWITMPFSLVAAFVVAVPVNRILLARGKGHALVYEYHHHDS